MTEPQKYHVLLESPDGKRKLIKGPFWDIAAALDWERKMVKTISAPLNGWKSDHIPSYPEE